LITYQCAGNSLPQTEANQDSLEPEEVSDLEADVEAAREWLDIDDDDSPEASKDILEIVKSCLKGMKKVEDGSFHQDDDTTYSHCRVCEASHPFPSSLYMQTAMFKCQPCNCPTHGQRHLFCTSIREKEAYLLRHHHLPPSKVDAHHGQYTLLDNEAVLHAVRRYSLHKISVPSHLICSVAMSMMSSFRHWR